VAPTDHRRDWVSPSPTVNEIAQMLNKEVADKAIEDAYSQAAKIDLRNGAVNIFTSRCGEEGRSPG
jgi:hypothetical protein